jgi:hypothetical protein
MDRDNRDDVLCGVLIVVMIAVAVIAEHLRG